MELSCAAQETPTEGEWKAQMRKVMDARKKYREIIEKKETDTHGEIEREMQIKNDDRKIIWKSEWGLQIENIRPRKYIGKLKWKQKYGN